LAAIAIKDIFFGFGTIFDNFGFNIAFSVFKSVFHIFWVKLLHYYNPTKLAVANFVG